MPAEPITIYSRRVDPRGVLLVLRTLAPALEAAGDADFWDSIVIAGPRYQGREPTSLAFHYDGANAGAAGSGARLAGLLDYVAGFPEVPRKPLILEHLAEARFAVGTMALPGLDLDSDDQRKTFVLAVAQHLDGLIFTASALRDAAGRVLINSDGFSDPAAVLPRQVQAGPGHAAIEPETELSERLMAPHPPGAQRVARRALVLTSVTARGLLEREDPAICDAESERRQLLAWVAELEVDDEIEPDEWRLLQRPVGTLDPQDAIDAVWRVEGLSILAWALGLEVLPSYDKEVETGPMLRRLGYLDAPVARSVVSGAHLQELGDLETLRQQFFALHWRLRDFAQHPRAINFMEFAHTARFGPLDIRPYRLIDGDLALGDCALAAAPARTVMLAASCINERHRAVNWLVGKSYLYSETDTCT